VDYLGEEAPPDLVHLLGIASPVTKGPARAALNLKKASRDDLVAAVHAEANALATEGQLQVAMQSMNAKLDRAIRDELASASGAARTKAVEEFNAFGVEYSKAVAELPGGILKAETLLSKSKKIQDAYYKSTALRDQMDSAANLLVAFTNSSADLETVICLYANPSVVEYKSILDGFRDTSGKESFHEAPGALFLVIARLGVGFSLTTPAGAMEREHPILRELASSAPKNPYEPSGSMGQGSRPVKVL